MHSSTERSLQQTLNKADRVLARHLFWEFCLYYDKEFFERRPFLQSVAQAQQKIFDGKIKSLSISLPPRAGKSYITSLFAAWVLGNRPTGSVMRNTCTATLYEKFSYDTRSIIRSEKYAEVFPKSKLAEDKQSLNGWNLTQAKQVSYFGAGVGGTIIGFGASEVAITDDLYKSLEDALSEGTNEKVHRWKESAHDSRLEKNCPKIDIGTRWSTRDVIGKNIEENKYDLSIVVPALDKNGNSFCEDVKTTQEYHEIKRGILSEIWEAEYMQSPAEFKGLLFPRSTLKRFSLKQFRENEEAMRNKDSSYEQYKVGYWDVADDGDDALCGVIGNLKPKKVFITDLIYTTDNVNHTLPRTVEMLNTIEPNYTRIESNSQGSVFHKWVSEKVKKPHTILPVPSKTNKHTRIIMQQAFITEYCYFLCDDEIIPGSEYDLFMRNLTAYMKDGSSKHDDAPDAVSGLAQFIQGLKVKLFNA